MAEINAYNGNVLIQIIWRTNENGHSTFKFNRESRQAHRGVAPKCQENTVSTALDSFWGLRALEASKERPVGIFSFIDVQEVIAGLHVETRGKRTHPFRHLWRASHPSD